MDPAKGAWILPTRGHSTDRLPAFLKAAVATGVSTPGIIVVDRDDYDANLNAYDSLSLPNDWVIAVYDGEPWTADKSNWIWKTALHDAEWVGWLADDLKPETPNWDTKLIDQLNGWNVISSNDGLFAPRKLNGGVCWSNQLLKAAGYIYAPGLRHFYVDDTWERIGRKTGCWHVDMQTLVRHEHDLATGRLDRMKDHKNSAWENDERVFSDWCKNEEGKATERILAVMQQNGAVIFRPDTTGISVMLGVPSMTRQYDGRFMVSYVGTRDYIRHFGGDLVLAEMAYSSDVVIARTMLFGSFLRSRHTHLLLIDDDMGWKPDDVLRMLHQKKDFIAVAGPRKVNPPSFAVSCENDDGTPGGVDIDPTTGLLTGPLNVGMAFTLLSRACVERMAQSYADLEIVTADGRTNYGVFLPMIQNRKYYGEDFAFCKRWRAIGGQIFIDSSVNLDHVGMNVWDGDWLSDLVKKTQQQAAA